MHNVQMRKKKISTHLWTAEDTDVYDVTTPCKTPSPRFFMLTKICSKTSWTANCVQWFCKSKYRTNCAGH